jgi:hypothetical protein
MAQCLISILKLSGYNTYHLLYLILPAALGPGVYSASNRNEYQKYIKNVSEE